MSDNKTERNLDQPALTSRARKYQNMHVKCQCTEYMGLCGRLLHKKNNSKRFLDLTSVQLVSQTIRLREILISWGLQAAQENIKICMSSVNAKNTWADAAGYNLKSKAASAFWIGQACS